MSFLKQSLDNIKVWINEDINEKLDNLSKNVNSVTINSNAQASRAKEILIEAQDNFDRGKYCEAYAGFKKYTGFEPDSCVGYEGMYKVCLLYTSPSPRDA